MIAVIFEVEPTEGRRDDYLGHAAALRESLLGHPGFISVERFESLSTSGKLLSLSFFEDEASVVAWRNRENHRASQAAGRGGVFAGYRLRVAQVLRDYGMHDRDDAPQDSREAHD